jgi:CRISPR-associated endoribonuclease Cas6
LHGRGFISGVRSFKLFTFSRLTGPFNIDKEKGEIIFPQGASFVVSSPSVEFCTSLLNCLLSNGSIHFGMSNAEIAGIKVEKPEVESKTISLKVLSPVVTYSTFLKPDGGKYTCYFQPGEKEFALQVGENLRKKYQAFYNQPAPTGEVEVRLRGTPRMNLVGYKGMVIRGYSCRLQLSGPRELLQMGLEAGLGAKNSQGFGCVEVAG